ncbi:MAG: glycosyltransferase [Candidatus Omnitrophica bacterium]|nr:glycosyltransferase [Candidatus Omnitrophota bacterium]MCF7891795.1 glycosyltransferase [Candidatus Omnitrophota bacterium]MCF7898172.1 glycosyltransferase [Candidatus Omnitrophota bacterium]MCF7909158.1 glycosyltransferase [Candidatus Omnitrophota bacterium]
MNKKKLIDSLILFTLVAVMVYVITRAVLVGYADYTGWDRFSALGLLLAELFVIFHGVGYTLNIYRAYKSRGEKEKMQELASKPLGKEPSVAIFVAARHEPKEVLEETFISIKNLKYKNKSIYFLDDSSRATYKKEADQLAKELDLKIFRRKDRHGAKAGIINDCLKTIDSKYLVVFDADQNPLPEFLNRVVSVMESDQKLAFLQTPQFYSNVEGSQIAKAAAFQQAVFYEYICEGKSSQDAMFCCGTNIIFRKKALDQVGGLDESTVTEDFATSFKFHQRGWKSLYYNHVYAFGMGPEDLVGYFRQQYRWANGTITVFKKVLKNLILHPFSLKIKQWVEYLLSSSYYLIGFALFGLMLFPIFYLLFDVPSFFAKPEVYLLAFLPYITLSLSVFYFVLKERNYTAGDLFKGQLAGFISFPIYLQAAVSSFFGRKATFGITSKAKGSFVSYFKLWPQILLLFLNYIAIVWGMNRFIYQRDPAVVINAFWAFYHLLLLSSVFYFNERIIPKAFLKKITKERIASYQVLETNRPKPELNSRNWPVCFATKLPDRLKEGTLLMAKVKNGEGEQLIFDAEVTWVSSRKRFGGYTTGFGVTKASSEIITQLRKLVKK